MHEEIESMADTTMKLRKLLLIGVAFLLLPSCSLFEATPQKVVNGQLAVYQSVIIAEKNALQLLDVYVRDCKKLAAYHENYIMQLDIDDTMRTVEDAEKRAIYHRTSETNRDRKLKRAYDLIDKKAEKMRQQIKKHHKVSLKLVDSVYNYLSTTPINIDNLEYWIEQLDETSKELDKRMKEAAK